MDVQKSIRMAVDTGKVLLGKNESFRSINTGQSKLVLFASNISADLKIEVEKRAKLAGVAIHSYEGTSKELGSTCGKPYPISILSVMEAGDSDILSLADTE